jgi:CubicO group peptidase (beta-lactamase class C family)
MKNTSLIRFVFVIGIVFSCAIANGEDSLAQKIGDFILTRMPELMERNHVPGACASVVMGDKIVYSRGFGFGDAEKKIAVDPATTLFRAGSISKLFVWTAIMQLYEKGLVDLDADINTYLGEYTVPQAYGKPITIKDLMAHTAGFEDRIIGLFTKDEKKIKTLAQVITENRPNRIRASGKEISYSNYGAMLAGFIVQRVSGMLFEEYVEKNIFEPLGMTRSTFRQPVPEALKADLSPGYVFMQEGYIAEDFEIVQGAPAGSISTTADDIARFLIAHLNNGEYLGKRILGEKTAILMHQRHYSSDPAMNGFAHGFIEIDMNGKRIIGHGGDTIYFHSIAGIMPEEKIGIYFSTNSSGGGNLAIPLFMEIVNKFFPAKTGAELVADKSTYTGELRKYEGVYRIDRRDESNLTKLVSLGMTIQVKLAQGKAALLITDIMTRELVTCVEIAPRIFQEEKGTRRYVFLQNVSGEITSLMFDYIPVFTFLKAPFYEDLPFNGFIVLFTVLFLLIGFFAKPTGILTFVLKKNKATGLAAWCGFTGSALILSWLLTLTQTMDLLSHDFVFSVSEPPVFPSMYASMVLTIAMVIGTIMAWLNKYWATLSRIFYTLLTIDGVFLVWLAIYWKMIF